MHKALKRSLLVVMLIAFLSTISYCSAPYDTETANFITIRKTITGSGFILREETPVTQSANGVFEASAKEGTRVSKGSSVGVSISGNKNDELVAQLTEVTKRIEEIEQSDSFADIYASDEARIFTALKNLTASIRDDSQKEDYSSATENASQLSILLQKKYSAENGGAADQLLLDLKKQKYELEQKLGGIRENITAPASGYFYKKLDGLEDCGTEADISMLTAAKVNNFSKTLENYKPDKNYIAKIVDTYAWYLAATVPAEEASNLDIGAEVELSMDDSVPVSATVLAINHKEGDAEAAIIIKSSRNITDIYEKRTAEFEICYRQHSGLYVPAAAIRVVNNVTGVYVLNRSESVTFKCVDIILQEKDYYIVSSNYVPPEDVEYSALKLYDDILVNPEVVDVDDP